MSKECNSVQSRTSTLLGEIRDNRTSKGDYSIPDLMKVTPGSV